LLTVFFLFVAPHLYHRIKFFVSNKTETDIMHGSHGGQSSHPDCVENARWANHDEELDHHHHHDFRHLVKTSFNLPLDSDLLYFLARGSLSHGSIEITDDGSSDDDKVVVDVSFLYVHDVALENVQVCHLQREGAKNGVGIFSPSNLPPRHHDEYRSHFAVVVHLPNGAGDRHLYEALETDMPIFVHHIGDLDQSAIFRSMDLKTTNAPIHVQSLTVQEGSLKTSNSPIEGKIATSSHLELHTTNGPLKTDVTVYSKGGAEASKLILSTRNSPIRSSISLVSLTEDQTGGSFDVAATTSNGPIDIIYPSAPVNSTLTFSGHSSNSPVHATLHKAYEGSFDLATSFWAQPSVRYDDGAEDPSGAGRRRIVETSVVQKGHAAGRVYWEGPGARKDAGSMKLSTSNAGISLVL